MRQIAKPVFWVVAIAFVGWLAYGQVTEIIGVGADVVLKVNGESVRNAQFQTTFQAALENLRREGGGQLSLDDRQQVENQVTEQLIQRILLQHEYRRLGIHVSDDEISRMAFSSPPPQVARQLIEDPQFQTNGQFDLTKWQRYLPSAGDEFKAQIEQLWRDYLPERKLEEYLSADVYVSDSKLWRIWRDQHESVTVALLAIQPDQVPDSLVRASDGEVERYYAAHKDDYKRPATAWLSFVALSRVPDAADVAAALARAQRLRAEIARGAKFEDVAAKQSADSVSGARGGDLGWVKRDEPGFDPKFLAGMRALRPGQLSPPVLSNFGYHLIRVDAANGDSIHARHILIPIEPQGEHLEAIEARADSLDRLAAEQTDGTRLDAAAQQLGLSVVQAPRLIEGDRLTLGRYVIPDVSVWAFETRIGETSPVIEAERAYYVFRLDSLEEAGVAPLALVRDRVAAAARYERKKEILRQRADQALSMLADSPDLLRAARARDLPVEKLGPFTRLDPPSVLAREPVILGAAFALRPGERSGVLGAQTGYFVLQGIARTPADSAAWLAQRDRQREAIMRPALQARVTQYLAALRAQAKVVDRRKEVYRPDASAREGE
ncbi:MAG TPA: peptidyl-prolyl cis-trans isomerase [Gemmatimonadales bacterium]|nr:peptidyl-prolyl cis-trans isomerase [Gemmatimonadales bacterium]